jgi:hypothetical protein
MGLPRIQRVPVLRDEQVVSVRQLLRPGALDRGEQDVGHHDHRITA